MKKSERKGDEKYKSLEQTAKRRIYVHLVVLVLLTVGVFAAMAFVISPQQVRRGAVHRTTGGQGICRTT